MAQFHDGYTLLHEIASRGPPPGTDTQENLAWDQILTELDADGVWSMSAVFDWGELSLTA
jgi:hypothetical protein